MVLVNGVEVADSQPQQEVKIKGKRYSCEGELNLNEGLNQGSLFQEGDNLFVLDASGKKLLRCTEQK